MRWRYLLTGFMRLGEKRAVKTGKKIKRNVTATIKETMEFLPDPCSLQLMEDHIYFVQRSAGYLSVMCFV